MKGIIQQMEESKVQSWDKFTQKDLDDLVMAIELGVIEDAKYRKKRIEELESNRKFLIKRAKELNKRIPFEVVYHSFLSFNRTYVTSEYLEKYKEWL